ncbi:hypothetical protein NV379_02140 [Paenibacillus sp. N1-5-1-14]|uniref:hypothetical protein n=1 Tax=Paenibacillus radicibacter TaxID=2972488 RepID=UPI002158B85E|nr:hypothetical protein [Paenibacillus radicibacter]MCR8641446.1 hypothetical protein [Paenibacillus radicibacter]
MPRPRVYKLEFTPSIDGGVDPQIYFKTTIKDEELVMLIKVWMYKLADFVMEYYFTEEEMMELLEAFGCKQISKDDNFRTYYSADMYEIWEAANIEPTEEDMNNLKFQNEQAQKVFDKVLKRSDDEYLEHALKDEKYKKYNDYAKKDFDAVAQRNGVVLE